MQWAKQMKAILHKALFQKIQKCTIIRFQYSAQFPCVRVSYSPPTICKILWRTAGIFKTEKKDFKTVYTFAQYLKF